MAIELPPTPGTSGIEVALKALVAAADALELSAQVNREQVTANAEYISALATQNADLTATADSAVQVAAGIRGLLPVPFPTDFPQTMAPQAAIFGGGKLIGGLLRGGQFTGSIANLLAAVEALTLRVRDLAGGLGK